VTAGVGGSYALDAYVLGGGSSRGGSFITNADLILASDLISEYICDYLDGSPLSYLA
jgi:hypothetical protein